MNSLTSLVRCAQENGLTLSAINGNVDAWCRTCRNTEGRTPTSTEFAAEWDRQLTLRTLAPINSFEVDE